MDGRSNGTLNLPCSLSQSLAWQVCPCSSSFKCCHLGVVGLPSCRIIRHASGHVLYTAVDANLLIDQQAICMSCSCPLKVWSVWQYILLLYLSTVCGKGLLQTLWLCRQKEAWQEDRDAAASAHQVCKHLHDLQCSLAALSVQSRRSKSTLHNIAMPSSKIILDQLMLCITHCYSLHCCASEGLALKLCPRLTALTACCKRHVRHMLLAK